MLRCKRVGKSKMKPKLNPKPKPKPKVDGHIHVVPTEGKPHDESRDCWCEPELHSKDEETDIEVWSHKGYEELEQ